MEPWGVVYAIAVLMMAGLIHHWVYRWRNPKCNGRLPPGSMGLPLIGETLQYLIPSKSIDIHPFIKTRTFKYGRIFKTSLGGHPVVVSADPDFNYYILQQEGKLVEMWYLDSFAKLMDVRGSGREGEPITLTSFGHVHKYFRNLLLNQVGPEPVRERLLPNMEETSRKALLDWSTRDPLEVKKAISSVICSFTSKLLYGFEPEKNMSERFGYILQGLMSLPLNIPGSVFNKCLKNRKVGLKLMKDLIDERRAMPAKRRGDFLDQLLDGMKTESFLSDDFVIFAMFAILFASFEMVSSSLTLTLILLTENPSVLNELEREHEEIIRSREKRDSMLTWKEYKSMKFTMQVVNESLRIFNAGPGLMRRAIRDIHVNGYTIPEGWTILAVSSSLQLNPETFQDPLAFNPWRWNDLDATILAKNFIPFGGGGRMCLGADFTKAFTAIFLHVLVSNYRWEKVKGGVVTRSPVLGFGDGFYINVCKKNNGQSM